MLYQWEIGRTDLDEVVRTYPLVDVPDREPLKESLADFAVRLARGTAEHLKEIDALIAGRAENWRLERMAVVDRLVLRLAVFEFLHTPETPRTVVINEALELARTFGDEESVRFVNGVLDGINKGLP